MLRDNLKRYNPPAYDDLSVKQNHEVAIILDFIDNAISEFPPYFITIKDSDRENRISDFLVHHFQISLRDKQFEGFPPFDFRKNPSQAESGKETDIGVVVLTRNSKPLTIIEFEAKRLSNNSNNKEYVCGIRGGIERFKRGLHGSHLSICGMFGYIQNTELLDSSERINNWISELASMNTDNTIDWTRKDEKLVAVKDLNSVTKWASLNARSENNKIQLFHYLINLIN